MEHNPRPFSAASVTVDADYVAVFPNKDSLFWYMEKLCTEFHLSAHISQSVFTIKGPWDKVVKMENMLATLCSLLKQSIINKELPSDDFFMTEFSKLADKSGRDQKSCVQTWDGHGPLLPTASETDISSGGSQTRLGKNILHSEDIHILSTIQKDSGKKRELKSQTARTTSPRALNSNVSFESVCGESALDIYDKTLSDSHNFEKPTKSSVQKNQLDRKAERNTKCVSREHLSATKRSMRLKKLQSNNAKAENECSKITSESAKKPQHQKTITDRANNKVSKGQILNGSLFQNDTDSSGILAVCQGDMNLKISTVTCQLTGKESSSMEGHPNIDEKPVPVMCGIKKSLFTAKKGKETMIMDKDFTCAVCDMKFKYQRGLSKHVKCHKKAQFSCDVCGKTYKEYRKLRCHKETHAPGYIKSKFPCDQCSKSYSTKYVLTYHKRSVHLNITPSFICETCGRCFNQKSSYLQHVGVHKKGKKFVCRTCGMKFSHEKTLKEHKFIHIKGKAFICNVCSKPFRKSSALSVHMKIHNVIKDYICSVCGKGFSQRQSLTRHERIHAGVKPFECCICARFFSDSSVLRRHMLMVHKRNSQTWREDTKYHGSKGDDSQDRVKCVGLSESCLLGETSQKVSVVKVKKSKSKLHESSLSDECSENISVVKAEIPECSVIEKDVEVGVQEESLNTADHDVSRNYMDLWGPTSNETTESIMVSPIAHVVVASFKTSSSKES